LDKRLGSGYVLEVLGAEANPGRALVTAWALAFLALQAADVLTTLAGLGRPGVYEANPLAAWLFATVGFWAILPLKATASALVLLLAWRLWRRFPARAWPLWLCNLGYVAVVASNAGMVV
jgi:threonine/homoserine efflux transporter RhtA